MTFEYANHFPAVDRAFSRQSVHYDEHDRNNPILRDMRQQVYRHIERFIKPESRILELNAGTGIDALYLAKAGHNVLAIDLAEGMIRQIQEKLAAHDLHEQLSCLQLSYDQLDRLSPNQFDYVFSNFGGLNCIDDLSKVTSHLPALLRPGAFATWVIMPPIHLWEWLGIFKGNFGNAFRRLRRGGVMAHLEGEYFKTYYHSLRNIKTAFGPAFRFVCSEGLAALSPPPHRGDFPSRHPTLYRWLRKVDAAVRSRFPFNRWADHIIVTVQYMPRP